MKNKNIVIFGANSEIAKKLIEMLEIQNKVYKVTSNKDLINRDNENSWYFSTYEDFSTIDNVLDKIKDIDIAIIFNGKLTSFKNSDFEKKKELININFVYPSSIISKIINKNKNKNLQIAAISSVAGDRGRHKNIIYSSSKAALTSFLSSMRQRYSNYKITTVKLGMVKTNMTKDLDLPPFLADKPEDAANLIYNGILSKKDIIISFKWSIIMFIVKILPEKIFKKFKF